MKDMQQEDNAYIKSNKPRNKYKQASMRSLHS